MEEKKQERSIAEEARKNTIEFLKNKYSGFKKLHLEYAATADQELPKELQEEYQKRYEEEYKHLQQLDNLKKQLYQKQKTTAEVRTIEELTDTLKRLQAEFENYKKRIDKEKVEFTKLAHADLIAQMLPVLDSFEIALKNTNDKEKFVEGMKMIYAQFHSILEAEGLRAIKTSGEKFDPYRHEVLMKEESDKPEDTILEEFQKGYMLNDKVLRHSKVKISGK